MLNEPQVGGSIYQALNGHSYGNHTNPTLILSHGFGSDQTVWHCLIPTLAYFFKVVVFDLAFTRPGLYDPVKYSNYTGYANDLISVLDELQVNQAIYVGHSMSAMIGCLASIKRPSVFQQLILLGGSPRYLNAEGYEGGFSRTEIDLIFEQIQQNYSSWVDNFARMAVLVDDTDAITNFKHSLLKIEPNVTLSTAKSVFLSDLRNILPHVQVPSYIIQSEVDNIVPMSVARYMKEELGKSGNSNLKILPTNGHFTQLTACDMLLSVIKGATGVGS